MDRTYYGLHVLFFRVQCIQLKVEFRSVTNNQGLEQTEERGEYHQGEDLLEGQGQVKDGLLKEQGTVAGVGIPH